MTNLFYWYEQRIFFIPAQLEAGRYGTAIFAGGCFRGFEQEIPVLLKLIIRIIISGTGSYLIATPILKGSELLIEEKKIIIYYNEIR